MVEPATICLSVLSGETFEVCLPASDVEILASLSGDVKEGLSMAKVLVLKRLREQHGQKLPEKVAEALKELDFVTGRLDTASANSAFVANAAERLRLVNNNPNNTNMTDVEASGVEAKDALLHPTLGCAGLIMLFCRVPGPTSKLTKDWLRVMDEKSKTKNFTDIERPNDRMRERMPEDDQCARLSASVVHSAAELAQQFSADISYTVVDPNDNPVPRTGAIFLRTTWAVVDPDRVMSGDSCRLEDSSA
ncbi:unnamed protein product [Polarella glacialis]|uniref:Uncharacterized protein n=1 Tax=Polarella glacialis TaxID=89957 RepID=A0A813DG34_POLGL|nr:unnamed protein product [Polarella glacialis]